MELIKQYIIQSISAASNNLRLSTQKIEVVALLRETIVKSENLEVDIKGMKKITELSTLAIRLNEIYSYLTQNQIDLFKLSDKFKEHSQFLIKDLSHMLDMVNPATFKSALEKLKENSVDGTNSEILQSIPASNENGINVDLSKRKPDSSLFAESESNKLKEKIIFEEDKEDEDLFFQNYENEILKTIKPIDGMLKQLSKNEVSSEELSSFAKVMKTNGDISAKIGFDIIANMHWIISKALQLIKTRELMPGKEVIESVRACLIVIVALVRGKEVDINNYLNRAEEFGKEIQTLNSKENI
ncbi:MAG TPA: hypothetical protein VMV36_02275 [Ignavibacteriaceae bacterium]|nr:hypothetical protein [Ignavibacteriaceae bacterium]